MATRTVRVYETDIARIHTLSPIERQAPFATHVNHLLHLIEHVHDEGLDERLRAAVREELEAIR